MDKSADESYGKDLDKCERSNGGSSGIENGRNHEDDRSCDQDFSSVEHIDEDGREWPEDGHGDHREESDEAEGSLFSGEVIDICALSNHLHLGTGEGDEGSEPEEAKIAVAEDSECGPGLDECVRFLQRA